MIEKEEQKDLIYSELVEFITEKFRTNGFSQFECAWNTYRIGLEFMEAVGIHMENNKHAFFHYMLFELSKRWETCDEVDSTQQD